MILYSCSIKKYIPEGEKLYTGAKIEIEADSAVENIKALKSDLETVLRPEPNFSSELLKDLFVLVTDSCAFNDAMFVLILIIYILAQKDKGIILTLS